MALNFPNSPALNDIYTDNVSGFSYQWNGTVWISFSPSSSSQIKALNDFSASFNSSTTIFPLTSGGNPVTPPTPQSLIINLGGVIQDPTDDYSVAGSNITFSTPPASGLSFSGVSLGPAVPIGVSTIGDVYNRQVYSVVGVQTSFAFPSGYTVGYLDVFRNGVRLIAGDDFAATTGNSFSLSPPAQNTDDVEAIGYKVSTIAVTEGNLIDLIVNQNATVLGITSLGAGVGVGQTALFVHGNARVTGILTVGSSSITLNGITDIINVGTGVTINGTSGTISASSFSGDGSGLTGVGVGATDNINTTGIITASIVSANEFIGTGDGLIFSPTITSFSPTDGATGINALSSPNIALTYNQPVVLGVGTITLREDSASGDIIESYTVGVSTRATVSSQTLTIDPTDNFDYDQEYFLVVPFGSVTNFVGGNSKLLDTYNFTTEAGPVATVFNPADGATGVVIGSNIVITFDKNIRAGVGTITLRTVSAGGTIVESYDVASSGRLTFSTDTLTIDPTSNLALNTNHFVVVPNNAVAGYAGTDTYDFTSEDVPPLGDSYEGGFLICCASPLRWVVSPYSAEVSRTWYNRNDANTTAQSASGCTGWFVPTRPQLQNPGYCCRSFWGPSPCFSSSTIYWSSTENSGDGALRVSFGNGVCENVQKTFTYCVRAFRCVTY